MNNVEGLGLRASASRLALTLLAESLLLLLLPLGSVSQERPAPEDRQWPRAAKDHANTRFSDLDKITAENARDMKLAWTFPTGLRRGQEAAPIVVNDTMYVVTPYPNTLYA